MARRGALARRLALAALGAVIAALPAPSRAVEPYPIQVILPLTGGGAFLGNIDKADLEPVPIAASAR